MIDFKIFQPRPLFCLFSFFSNTILQKNCRLQRDSNLDRRISRRTRWPLDHPQHGPRFQFCKTFNTFYKIRFCHFLTKLQLRRLVSPFSGLGLCLPTFVVGGLQQTFLGVGCSLSPFWYWGELIPPFLGLGVVSPLLWVCVVVCPFFCV